MGIAKNPDLPEFCPSCTANTPSMVTLNESAQQIATCARCGQPKLATALSRPMAATGALIGDPATRAVPVRERKAESAEVIAFPGAGGARSRAAGGTRVPVLATAEDIVANARAQVAQLDAEIPALVAELAKARAHRKGLAKMVEAYDRASKRQERAAAPVFAEPEEIEALAVDDPGPPPEPRMKRSEARGRASGGGRA